MPYLDAETLAALTERGVPDTPGELNYCLTQVAIQYVNRRGLSYLTCNDIIGAFTAARDEFYRRVVVPYENMKMSENGDVYFDPPAEEPKKRKRRRGK